MNHQKIKWDGMLAVVCIIFLSVSHSEAAELKKPVDWKQIAGREGSAESVIQIAEAGDSTFPGETLVITGTGLADASLIVRGKDVELTLKPRTSSDDRMLVELPKQLPLGALVAWPTAGEQTGLPIRINDPKIWWHWPLKVTEETSSLYLMGRNMRLKDENYAVYLEGDGFKGFVDVTEANPYQMTVRMPVGVTAGKYTLSIWNGSDLGWSDPLTFLVEKEIEIASSAVKNAKDFGAIPGDGKDDTDALQSGLLGLAVGETLLLENGEYIVSQPLVAFVPNSKMSGAGAASYNQKTGTFEDEGTVLKYSNVRNLPASLIEVRASGVELSGFAAENGNNGDDQSAIAVYSPGAVIHDVTLVMRDKREWGFVEPGPNFGTQKKTGTKVTGKVIDCGALFIDTYGRADTKFYNSSVHATGPGVLIGTLQAFDLEKENEVSTDGVLIENIDFSGYYAGEPDEKPNAGGSGRAVGVVLYNAKQVAVQNCSFQSADRAHRKIMCRTVLSLNTSNHDFYLADNRSENIGSHSSATGMYLNQGEQYLFHYRYPPGGLFDVVRAASDSVTLDPSVSQPFEENYKFAKAHYYYDARGSRVLPEVGQNSHWIVFICAGKGMGQYREVVSQGKDGKLIVLNVDKPWRVVPDETSRFNLTPAYRHITVFRNYVDIGEYTPNHKSHGVCFWFYALDNIVANNIFKNMSSGIVFNSRFRGPTAWNLTRENVVKNIRGYCGDTSLKPAGYVDHFRLTLDWPSPDDRVIYSLGNAARNNRFEDVDVGAYLHTRFTGQLRKGLAPVEHSTGGMVMSVIENSVFKNVREEGIVVESPANGCLLRNNQIDMAGPASADKAIVIVPPADQSTLVIEEK